MTPEQCRQARELLGWNPQRLALRANISRETVVSFENGSRRTRAMKVSALKLTLQEAGIDFFSKPDGGLGLRLGEEIGCEVGA